MMSDDDRRFLRVALAQARKSFEEGGIPVGAAIVRGGQLLAEGHNRRIQDGNPILHGEMDCLQRLGAQKSYRGMTLYTTLNPCRMCAGAIVQFRIPRVVIGQEAVLVPPESPFHGNLDYLLANGVDAVLLHDPDCEALFAEFLSDPANRAKWLGDIGE